MIISAGMPRSGSTLLYNMLREILLVKWGRNLVAGWEGDVDLFSGADVYLVKTHTITIAHTVHADLLFFSYRDIRTVAVSTMRMFGQALSFESMRANVEEYRKAYVASDLTVSYEMLVEQPVDVIARLAETLRINVVPESICERVLNLKPPMEGYAGESLLHKDHFRHTSDDAWFEIAPLELQQRVNDEFGWWFRECGYLK